jgi:PAS domain S-box-containing protein
MNPLPTALRPPGPRLAQGPAVQVLVRACAVLAFATLAGPWLASGFTTTVRWGMFGCLLAMALPLLPAALSRDERVQGWAMVASMAGTVLGLAGMSYFSRVGVHSVTLQSISVTVLAAGVLLHPVYAWALAALAIAAIAALAVVVPGLPDAVPFPLQASVANRVIAHTLGLALAVGIAHMLHAVLRQNERRMAGLLRIAARVYWELDAQQRLTCLSASEAAPVSGARSWHGLHWSELPGVQIAPQVAARLRERLQARQPFSDLHVRMDLGPHGLRDVSWSGEPRFDALGRFRGYWGVARDVTEQVEAQRQVAASEVRYRELFHNCPLPLVLHRAGTVLDANPAAVALFGHADPAAMQGRNIYHQYVDEDGSVQRGMARALQLLASEPGTMLPQTRFRIHGAGGRVRCVRATGTRMNVPDGPAVLSFFVDDTEQQAAEARLAQQQRLLEHLIDACPDSISLSEINTGRYVMINQAFTRMTGYTAEQAIGRSGMELGLWIHQEDRTRVIEEVRRQGRIEHFRTQSRRSNGESFMLALSGAAFTEDGHEYLVGVGRDTTESDRTRLEHEAILRRASIGIAYTRDQRFFHANAQWEQMFGWGPGELLDQAGRVIWPDDETYAAAGRVFAPALSQGRSVEHEGLMRRRDGSTFWCHLRGQVLDAGNTKAGTIWTAADVTERRRVEQALAAARDAAEAASRAKSAFLANMSHEIRTPLNGLMGLARLAQHDEVPVPRKQEYLRQIVDSAQCLSDVLSDILDLSKVEAGKLSIENVTFDLGDMLHKVHRAYLPLAQARGLRLELDIDGDVPRWLHGDLVRVRQIVTNFVTNALKFTRAGYVHVRARAGRAGAVYLEVVDSGMGIDAATQARLFRPFTQADESTTRRFGGTGLGLSICRQLAQLMGGEVGVSSQPGRGSRFWVELPLPRAEAAPVVREEPLLDEQPLAGARLLVAEDNPVNMMIAVAMLEQWGAQVEQAGDGRAAVERVEQAARQGRLFDAVLMDVQMPEMGGHEATALLRRRWSADELPVLGLTAAALVEERDAGLAAGMNEFLTKPIEPDRLRAALLRWCAAVRA